MNTHSRDKLTLQFNRPSRSLLQLPSVYNKFNTITRNHFSELYTLLFFVCILYVYTYIS